MVPATFQPRSQICNSYLGSLLELFHQILAHASFQVVFYSSLKYFYRLRNYVIRYVRTCHTKLNDYIKIDKSIPTSEQRQCSLSAISSRTRNYQVPQSPATLLEIRKGQAMAVITVNQIFKVFQIFENYRTVVTVPSIYRCCNLLINYAK